MSIDIAIERLTNLFDKYAFQMREILHKPLYREKALHLKEQLGEEIASILFEYKEEVEDGQGGYSSIKNIKLASQLHHSERFLHQLELAIEAAKSVVSEYNEDAEKWRANVAKTSGACV